MGWYIEKKLHEEAGRERSWNIKLVSQLAQSLDLNVNDLGFASSPKS